MLSNSNEFTVTLPELKPINGGLWIRQLVLLGTGNSASMPKLSCVLPRDQQLDAVCPACSVAVDPSKVWSPNRRLNTSAVLCYQAEDGPLKHILIDCGKVLFALMILFISAQDILFGCRQVDGSLSDWEIGGGPADS